MKIIKYVILTNSLSYYSMSCSIVDKNLDHKLIDEIRFDP